LKGAPRVPSGHRGATPSRSYRSNWTWTGPSA
jgi:hypothetical protein